MAIKLKTPDNRNSPAHGEADEFGDRLAAVGEVISQVDNLEDDPYSDAIAPAAATAANALEDVRRFAWSIADSTQRRVSAASGVLRGAAEAAKAAVPTSGWGGPTDLAAAQAQASRDVLIRAQRDAAAEVLGQKADEASSLGAAAQSAMVAFQLAIDSAVADFSGPRTMRRNAPQEDLAGLIRGEHRRVELANMKPTELLNLYKGFVARGEVEKAIAFEDDAAGYLNEIAQTPQPKLAARFTAPGGRNMVDDERGAAFQLIAMFRKQREARMPQSIVLGGQALNALGQCFRDLVGVSARFMSTAEFSRTFLDSDARGFDARAFPFDGSWPKRFLTPAPTLPGWSPVIAKTKQGETIRTPKDNR